MKIKIDNKDIELRVTMRAMIIFEKIADKAFNITTVTDLILYFYANILACYPDFNMTFDEFLSYLDENSDVFKMFTDFIEKENTKQNQFDNNDSDIKKKIVKK